MNLLNKKIKDKLKDLEDIDKQYITNIKNENNNIKKHSKINDNLSSIEIIKRTNNENFDKIYSDFFLKENKYLFNKGGTNKKGYSFNNLDNLTKEDSNQKDKNNDSIKNISSEKYNINNNNGTKKQYYTGAGINVADRLNNYGKFINNKIKNKRQIQDNEIKKLMKPKGSTRSGSNTKNPEKISERLYLNYKKNIVKKNKDNSVDHNSNNISNPNNFTYHPKLNKNSILIAQKLEPSFIRLNKRKKTKDKEYEALINNNKDKKNINYNLSLINNNNHNHNNSNKKNKDNKNIKKKMNNLYLKGIEQNQKKEKIHNEHQKKKEDEYKNYSFKPIINNSPIYNRNNNNIIDNKKNNNSKKEKKNIYKKNFEWKQKIENEKNKKKEKRDETINSLCTFKPTIIEYNYHNNEKKISKILDQMSEYVNKRRRNIKYKKDEEEYKYKRIYGSGNNYIVKSTIPQEFELETEIRNRDMNKNKNRSCDNFHIKKNNLLLGQFSEKKCINYANNQKYWFFKENMNNCYSHNNTRTNNKYNETLSQIDFIEAVSLLHDKLDKLNI